MQLLTKYLDIYQISGYVNFSDECREAALACSDFCVDGYCSLRPGSRRELYRDCEEVLEWETCVDALGPICDDGSVAGVRDIIQQFNDFCTNTSIILINNLNLFWYTYSILVYSGICSYQYVFLFKNLNNLLFSM